MFRPPVAGASQLSQPFNSLDHLWRANEPLQLPVGLRSGLHADQSKAFNRQKKSAPSHFGGKASKIVVLENELPCIAQRH